LTADSEDRTVEQRRMSAWSVELLRALRPAHWVKNALVLVPAVASHRALDPHILVPSILTVIVFCATSSAVYLLNDIRDIDADRNHPRKQSRPLVTGALPVSYAWIAAVFLIMLACGVTGWVLRPGVLGVIIGYLFLNLAYSLRVKQIPIADILLLTSFYLLRVLGGAIATNIYVSPWLFGFCFFSLLSIALSKRFAELMEVQGNLASRGRGYEEADAMTLRIAGIAAAFASCLVFAIYIESPAAARLYHAPIWLWGANVVCFYYLLRIWILAGRGHMRDDPVFEIIRDPWSWVGGLIITGCVVLSKVGV